MPNLRGRTNRKDHKREHEGSESARDAESDDEFNFGSSEEAEGSSQKKEPKSAKYGGDEANKGEKAKTETWSDVVKGLKTEDELETTNL